MRRRTNRAGGIEGGMSTGEVLRLRAAMKPISTVPRALETIDVATGEPAKAINQRSDVTAVPAAGVVAEAMVALVLAEAATEKFGETMSKSSAGTPKAAPRPGDLLTANGWTAGRPVVLIGPPTAGGSFVGELLAQELGVPFADTDDLVATAARKPVSDIFMTTASRCSASSSAARSRAASTR